MHVDDNQTVDVSRSRTHPLLSQYKFCSDLMRVFFACASAATLVISPLAAQAQRDGISYPRKGEVCDQVGQVCYDSAGPSIGITKIYFGQYAADRLTQNLRASSSRDFRLSSGQACSVEQQTCWNDGWNAKNKAKRLTKQLFGASSVQPAPKPQKQVAQQTGFCSLSEGGRPMFDGPCDLKQVVKGNSSRYRIHLGNGNTYLFTSQGGHSYTITDSFGGTWPVTFVDHGNTGVFRFANYKLVATQNNGSRQPTAGDVTGAAVNVLLQTLFK